MYHTCCIKYNNNYNNNNNNDNNDNNNDNNNDDDDDDDDDNYKFILHSFLDKMINCTLQQCMK